MDHVSEADDVNLGCIKVESAQTALQLTDLKHKLAQDGKAIQLAGGRLLFGSEYRHGYMCPETKAVARSYRCDLYVYLSPFVDFEEHFPEQLR